MGSRHVRGRFWLSALSQPRANLRVRSDRNEYRANQQPRHRQLPTPRPSRLHTPPHRLHRHRHRQMSYSAYGTPTCEGSATTPLGYDAQYTSSDTGLIYLRARVYDPSTAQFLTHDPLEAITGEPYSYAGDNPVNYSDPTGLIFGIP